MTDFGRRAGTGDMLKSVYDPILAALAVTLAAHKTQHQNGGTDEITVAALSGELADDQPPKAHNIAGTKHAVALRTAFNAKIFDANFDDETTARPPAHHGANHALGQFDPIDVTGLVGTTPRAIQADATPGRVERTMEVYIMDGTNADTINVQTLDAWNGDTIAAQDNLAKGGDETNFALDAGGLTLTIKAAGLTGSAVAIVAHSITGSTTGAIYNTIAIVADNNIYVLLSDATDGTQLDLTAAVDLGLLTLNLSYLTDE